MNLREMTRLRIYAMPMGPGSDAEYESELRTEVAHYVPLLRDYVARMLEKRYGLLTWVSSNSARGLSLAELISILSFNIPVRRGVMALSVSIFEPACCGRNQRNNEFRDRGVSSCAWGRLASARNQRHAHSASLPGLGRQGVNSFVSEAQNRDAHNQVSSRDLRRLELEYDIPVLEAEALMPLRQDRHREGAPCGSVRRPRLGGRRALRRESGLVLAEIELRDEHEYVDLPPWIGPEVTGQPQYYNSDLCGPVLLLVAGRDTPAPIERLA